MNEFMYASKNEAEIFESKAGKSAINRILLGTYVSILEKDGDWFKVATAGPDGWMHKDSLCSSMGLKVFFLDVGQGDGILIEIGKYKILIDGGPDKSLYNYLKKWQYTYILNAGEKVHIDYLIVSHFDLDHYKGFINIIKDKNFTFGTICHAGILKFASKDNPYNSGLGNTIKSNDKKLLTKIFDSILEESEPVAFNRDLSKFTESLQIASSEGRVGCIKRFEAGNVIIDEKVDNKNFKIEVLAPFIENEDDQKGFIYWENDGKTINGHSLVLKLSFGSKSLLLCGDLNSLSEEYIMTKYSDYNPFNVDVSKSCHHGASDFTEKFMELISPYATVISSGDNEGFSHPRADAIGCAGKYSKSIRPLVFNTELARSTDLKSKKILYGLINLRCDGNNIYISQMKEVKKNSDIWDSYLVE